MWGRILLALYERSHRSSLFEVILFLTGILRMLKILAERFVNINLISSSPSGCTFWGKKPWSRKKKLLWQLGTLIGAPVGIGLVAGIAVPAMIIGKYFNCQ